MKCPNCGETSRIRENDKYCHKCGCNLKEGNEEGNQFKSLHIDLEKKIFLLNGKPMGNVTELRLEACGMYWSLALSRDERYEAPLRKSQNKSSDNARC